MKFARDCRSSESNEVTAQLLFEALPWIKNLTGKTVVIKYGGAAMVDEQLRRDVMSDIVLLKIIEENGEELFGSIDDDDELDKVYNYYMEEIFADEDEESDGGAEE